MVGCTHHLPLLVNIVCMCRYVFMHAFQFSLHCRNAPVLKCTFTFWILYHGRLLFCDIAKVMSLHLYIIDVYHTLKTCLLHLFLEYNE